MADKDMNSPIIRKDTVLSLPIEVSADAWATSAVARQRELVDFAVRWIEKYRKRSWGRFS